MEFASQLKKLRKSEGLSQEDVANQIHVTRQSVSKWEAGDSTPDLTIAVKLAELFNVSLDYLVLNVEPKKELDSSNKQIVNQLRKLRKEQKSKYSDIADNLLTTGIILIILFFTYYKYFMGNTPAWFNKLF